MKITIKHPLKVFFIRLLISWAIITLLLIIGLILAVINYKEPQSAFDSILPWSYLFSLVILYLIYLIVDTLLFVKKSSVSLHENSIEVTIGNLLNQSHHSYSFPQITSVVAHQSFLLKLFGLSEIHIFHGSLRSAVWGYTFEESQLLATEFSKNFHVKVK